MASAFEGSSRGMDVCMCARIYLYVYGHMNDKVCVHCGTRACRGRAGKIKQDIAMFMRSGKHLCTQSMIRQAGMPQTTSLGSLRDCEKGKFARILLASCVANAISMLIEQIKAIACVIQQTQARTRLGGHRDAKEERRQESLPVPATLYPLPAVCFSSTNPHDRNPRNASR